jgi:hypothetical protein
MMCMVWCDIVNHKRYGMVWYHTYTSLTQDARTVLVFSTDYVHHIMYVASRYLLSREEENIFPLTIFFST